MERYTFYILSNYVDTCNEIKIFFLYSARNIILFFLNHIAFSSPLSEKLNNTFSLLLFFLIFNLISLNRITLPSKHSVNILSVAISDQLNHFTPLKSELSWPLTSWANWIEVGDTVVVQNICLAVYALLLSWSLRVWISQIPEKDTAFQLKTLQCTCFINPFWQSKDTPNVCPAFIHGWHL